ncbi:hypothetical protein CEUSTIGMA_g7411.t1 [Chlamydomonas eustigma]|uniref:Uncharacterized protein n=1 Tax=Chlamydomonas eustigma TaxID=1157962 RepID=A0A250XAT2_9CHLO|nr:hypothetical protein CEUSTIGMA_g7411.t1 [Chlamydomonas eustigma]|eukprot:GAX79972.1 hypothetical protein CEUSTIGMA_g7411.t1 [Chlamydomonas eustigma]
MAYNSANNLHAKFSLTSTRVIAACDVNDETVTPSSPASETSNVHWENGMETQPASTLADTSSSSSVRQQSSCCKKAPEAGLQYITTTSKIPPPPPQLSTALCSGCPKRPSALSRMIHKHLKPLSGHRTQAPAAESSGSRNSVGELKCSFEVEGGDMGQKCIGQLEADNRGQICTGLLQQSVQAKDSSITSSCVNTNVLQAQEKKENGFTCMVGATTSNMIPSAVIPLKSTALCFKKQLTGTIYPTALQPPQSWSLPLARDRSSSSSSSSSSTYRGNHNCDDTPSPSQSLPLKPSATSMTIGSKADQRSSGEKTFRQQPGMPFDGTVLESDGAVLESCETKPEVCLGIETAATAPVFDIDAFFAKEGVPQVPAKSTACLKMRRLKRCSAPWALSNDIGSKKVKEFPSEVRSADLDATSSDQSCADFDSMIPDPVAASLDLFKNSNYSSSEEKMAHLQAIAQTSRTSLLNAMPSSVRPVTPQDFSIVCVTVLSHHQQVKTECEVEGGLLLSSVTIPLDVKQEHDPEICRACDESGAVLGKGSNKRARSGGKKKEDHFLLRTADAALKQYSREEDLWILSQVAAGRSEVEVALLLHRSRNAIVRRVRLLVSRVTTAAAAAHASQRIGSSLLKPDADIKAALAAGKRQEGALETISKGFNMVSKSQFEYAGLDGAVSQVKMEEALRSSSAASRDASFMGEPVPEEAIAAVQTIMAARASAAALRGATNLPEHLLHPLLTCIKGRSLC